MKFSASQLAPVAVPTPVYTLHNTGNTNRGYGLGPVLQAIDCQKCGDQWSARQTRLNR